MITADIKEAIGLLEQGTALLKKFLETQGTTASPEEDRVGHIAYLHRKAEIEKGAPLTVEESLEIRRPFYGSRIQGSAALFGTKDSNHILYRQVERGTRRDIRQPVSLTAEGFRRAEQFQKSQVLFDRGA